MSNESVYLPLVALRGRCAFPLFTITFDAGREMSLAAIKYATDNNKMVMLVSQKDDIADDVSGEDDLYDVGVVASVIRTTTLPGNRIRVAAKGRYRVKVSGIEKTDGCLFAVGEFFPHQTNKEELLEAYFRSAKYALTELTSSAPAKIGEDVAFDIAKGTQNKEQFLYNAAGVLDISAQRKQVILSHADMCEQYDELCRAINDELEIKRLQNKINASVKRDIEKGQKEFYLREQLKAIHTELGDGGDDLDELKQSILDKPLPEEVKNKALKEFGRMSRMQSSSPDYNVIRNYLDWILDLEWEKTTQDIEKLEDAVEILNADHYGLEKIKERITEYLAVLKLTGGMQAPVLCLVGPPGVGKTSIATSIARALGREFVRMSLGGVSDESEIRGHRKTYVGAMPGRLITAIKNVNSINPVFLLDEIDKLSSDRFRGDPSSALLEALDPAQNSTFRDRYLEVPYDLSKVLFITTANDLSTIPAPLRDRMEIIEISGYTSAEKREIAKRYLVPKKIAANGLDENNITITNAAIDAVIDGYTREAGVRELERQIDAVCRKIAVKKAKGENLLTSVKKGDIAELLGAARYELGDELPKRDEVGTVTGLAWTAVGGTTLSVEVSVMRGKGEILLTGKLGDVMKESAMAALSYIRSNAQKYGLSYDDVKDKDIHVHVPEGATPKDGPSAGITIATAMLSAFCAKPVRRDVAMTGEITLRGNVLPIGGLKEKSLAAYRLGVSDVIIPKDNVKDLEDVPQIVKDNVKFIPVDNVCDVFKNAIVGI